MATAKVSRRSVGKTLGEVIPAVQQVLHNERVLITKVEALEAFRAMTLWQRVMWIVRGAQ